MKEQFEKILNALTNTIVKPDTDPRLLPELTAAADLAAKRISIIENKKNPAEVVN